MKLTNFVFAILLATPAVAAQDPTWLEWNASSGNLPEDDLPPWEKVNSGNGTTSFNTGSTAVVIETFSTGDNLWYEQSGSDELNMPDTLIIEFRLKIVSEHASSSTDCDGSRRAADITVVLDDDYGIGLAFGINPTSGFINFYKEVSNHCCNQGDDTRTVPTDVFQDYQLVIDTVGHTAELFVWDDAPSGGGVAGYYLELTDDLYDTCNGGTKPWIRWGAATNRAYGNSEWEYFAHNAWVGPIGTTYCDAIDNSTGETGKIQAYGNLTVSEDTLTIKSWELPLNQTGYYLASEDTQSTVITGSGRLCVDRPYARYNSAPLNSGMTGTVEMDVDMSAIPFDPVQPILAGETWHFQYWHRDTTGGPHPAANFTEAVTIVFDS